MSRNTVTGNGRSGVIVSEASANNRITGNVVTDNAQYGIRTDNLSGGNNVVDDNLL